MAERDSAKIEGQFHDAGYREGITAGKLSTLQGGFDQGFNEVGAPIGRSVGILRGQIAALVSILSSTTMSTEAEGASVPAKAGDAAYDAHDEAIPSSASSGAGGGARHAGRGRAKLRGAAAFRKSHTSRDPSVNRTSLPLRSHPRLSEAQEQIRAIATDLDAVTLAQIAPPDYEAIEHEMEHQAEQAHAQPSTLVRETAVQLAARERIVVDLRYRTQRVYETLGLAYP
ncbi:hypothetical protein BCV70DRAFT_200577 [Testicularia cyperi]|uniref:Protein YAE1 n=1 Tax=Testicularia cyperi TaxID=1882483 RepID=A0A317XMV2_9BASI|nr:hypothetical protein BCV70DRAFT_200577 [Testicularia cyperi]